MNGQIIPINDRVLIEPIDESEFMYGNIIVPDLGKERPEMGTVIATGPGRVSEFSGEFINVNCQVGDIVLVPKIGTIRVEVKGNEYYIAQDKEILAKFKPTEEDE